MFTGEKERDRERDLEKEKRFTRVFEKIYLFK
jgi:hypothetical protein